MTFADDAIAAIRDRIATLPTWTAVIDDPQNNDLNERKLAIVFDTGESTLFVTNSYEGKELSVNVLVQVRYEDAAPGQSPEAYRRQCVGEVRDVIFGSELELEGDWDLLDDGSTVLPSDNSNLAKATVNLRYRYKHDIGNASAFTGATA